MDEKEEKVETANTILINRMFTGDYLSSAPNNVGHEKSGNII